MGRKHKPFIGRGILSKKHSILQGKCAVYGSVAYYFLEEESTITVRSGYSEHEMNIRSFLFYFHCNVHCRSPPDSDFHKKSEIKEESHVAEK